MNEQPLDRRDYRFLIGLMAGTVVGAGLTMWLAPHAASELRARVANSAKTLGKRASDIRDEVAGAVASGAHEVERFAKAAKADGRG
jgi:gas vesicle protein